MGDAFPEKESCARSQSCQKNTLVHGAVAYQNEGWGESPPGLTPWVYGRYTALDVSVSHSFTRAIRTPGRVPSPENTSS